MTDASISIKAMGRREARSFRVHKAFLGARSPVFRVMFSDQFSEGAAGKVYNTISASIDADTVLEMCRSRIASRGRNRKGFGTLSTSYLRRKYQQTSTVIQGTNGGRLSRTIFVISPEFVKIIVEISGS